MPKSTVTRQKKNMLKMYTPLIWVYLNAQNIHDYHWAFTIYDVKCFFDDYNIFKGLQKNKSYDLDLHNQQIRKDNLGLDQASTFLSI